MANKFRVNYIVLSGQSLTANSNSPFINGISILTQNDSGNFATSNNLLLTGQQSYNTTIGGDTNLSGNITTTGITLVNQVNALSGYLVQRPELYYPFCTVSTAWAMPGVATFFNGTNSSISYFDLTRFTGVQLGVNKLATASSATGALYLVYNNTYSQTVSNYSYLTSNNTRLYMNQANTYINSGWQPITTNAKSGVYIALIGSGQNGTSLTFGNITMGLM